WQEIKRHPVNGADMLRNIPYLAPAIPIVRYHHERWNGQGYPDGLIGEEIPQGARIVAVADSFDAMTTNRPYSPARSLENAMEEIQRCSGTSYDPAVVEVFQSFWAEGQIKQISLLWKEKH
ncbi:MAG TPA: HD domain-containing phosphohydrolase, partial [Anaerolineales bacterium]|nr:HD domain-containing phosphohydrolase [Anaerolineales bacterium]